MNRSGVAKYSRARVALVAAMCVVGAALIAPGVASATACSPNGACLSITTTSPLPQAAVGSAYSTTLTHSSVFDFIAWVQSGLPAGLSLNQATGQIIGTPASAAAGTSQVTINAIADVYDPMLGPFPVVDQKTLTLNVLGIAPPALPQGALRTPYATPAQSVVGDGSPITWSASGLSGTGLAINPSTGAISGTPTAVPGSVTLTATDTTNHVSTSVPVSLPILDITSTSLPGGLANSPYSASPVAVGDASPLTWTASGLPAGLSINEFTGAITGTPASAGNSTVTLTVADATHRLSVTTTLPLTVLGINTSSLPGGTVGAPYSLPMSATGGAVPLTWSASNLPAGLSIDPSTGVISGTPTAVGNNVVTVIATDSSAPPVAAVLTAALNVAPAAAPPPRALGQLALGTITLAGTHATIPLTCQGSSNQICVGALVATATEHIKSGTVQAVTASAKKHGKGKKRGGAKGKTVSKVVTVATGTYSINAGQSANVPLTLNATGQKLLGEFFKLPVNLSVTGGVQPVSGGMTFKYGIINTTINYAWSFSPQSTTAQSLTIRGLRPADRVTVICRGGGCPFSQKHPKVKGGTLAITPLLGQAKLQPHTLLELVISAPNSVSQVQEFIIRAGAAPTAQSLCQAPGVRQPGTCRAP